MSSTPNPCAPEAPEAARSRFTVRAVREPSVLSRVVELFVLRDLIPAHVRCEAGETTILVELTVDGLDDVQANHVAQRIRQFPTVESVLLARA